MDSLKQLSKEIFLAFVECNFLQSRGTKEKDSKDIVIIKISRFYSISQLFILIFVICNILPFLHSGKALILQTHCYACILQ